MTTSTDTQLLKILSSRENYDNHARFIKKYTVLPEVSQLIGDIEQWYKDNPNESQIDWSEFKGWFRIIRHPTWKPSKYEVYDTIIDNVIKEKQPPDTIINRFIELDYATRIDKKIEEVFNKGGTDNINQIGTIVDKYNSTLNVVKDQDALVDMDLDKLLESISLTSGITWRLEDLNKSVGEAHPGDLIIIGKRPEAGGTTFLTSEFTHMVKQLPKGKNAIIFNNEESGNKIGMRYIQSALNATVMELANDPATAKADFSTYLDGKRLDVLHSVDLSTRQIDRVLRTGKYGLIGINVLDKINGFSNQEGVEKLRSLAQWARQIADHHGIVMAIMQADASAEGVKWLNQSQLYGSKTGVQGEADVLIMIGKEGSPGFEDTRFIKICKNKKPASPLTDPKLRHGGFEVGFDGERGRFFTKTF